ncbi:jg22186 [Pararge aegeria aegeria]|uniref:Jg22186 protein n=1 Tax=Pararge aegeria aegeria TaxID=348720 RepID=A0A8S4SG03_9NEOP|nr:jg22186 [Pararge aegeria aegeria]
MFYQPVSPTYPAGGCAVRQKNKKDSENRVAVHCTTGVKRSYNAGTLKMHSRDGHNAFEDTFEAMPSQLNRTWRTEWNIPFYANGVARNYHSPQPCSLRHARLDLPDSRVLRASVEFQSSGNNIGALKRKSERMPKKTTQAHQWIEKFR